MSPEEQFGAIAEALQDVESQSDKARIAQDIFGRSGMKLINTLNLGKDGLAAMKQEAKE